MEDFFDALLKGGVTTIPNILLTHLRQLTMTSDEFMLYVTLLSYQSQGVFFPSPKQLNYQLDFSENKIFQVLQELIEKKFISIETSTTKNSNVQQDRYDLMPIFKRLKLVLTQEKEQNIHDEKKQAQKDLFKEIEVEFNRVLSPIEIQTIDAWIKDDHYSPELIELALREAVLNQVYSLKYIDRILLTWEKKNIRTPAQVQREKDLRNQY